MKRFLISTILAILLVSLLPLNTVMAVPSAHLFWGTVTLDGSPAPDGTSVTATMSGYPDFSDTTSGGSYSLTINADTADIGKNIDFNVNGIYAASSTFADLGFTELNLSASSPPPQYTLTITTNGNGGASGATGPHNEGTVVSITATPGIGAQFDNWSGDDGTIANVNSANTTITMNGNYSITANFSPAPDVTLTMAVNGSGSTSPAVGASPYPANTVVNITATPDAGWQFDNWSGNVGNPSSATTTVTMDADKTVTANFSPAAPVTLTMAVNGSGSTSPAVGEHDYPVSTVVNITAIPASGWQFDSWTGDVADPSSASTTVTMDADKTVTANFSRAPDVTLTMAVNGNGSTSPTVGNHTYAAGTMVPIAAIADAGWQFDNWSGDVADPNSVITTIAMDADKTVTANFLQEGVVIHTLTITTSGNGSTTGAGTYAEGTVVNITATPDSGWQFVSWSGDAVANPSSASTTVTMDADKTVTANFSPVEVGDTTPPVISGISESNVTSSGADIGWTTDEPADSQVAYRANPGWLTSLDEALVTGHLVQLTGLQPGTTYYYKVMSRDGAGNLTVSAEYTFSTLGLPASFGTSDWSVSLAEVDAGKEATISFLVTNSGGLGGSYEITLTVNGVVEATREVTLGAEASEMVTFTTIKGVAGTYQVSVDELSFSFTVVEGEISPPADGINWWLVVGIIIGVLLLLLALLVLLVRADRIPARFIPGFIPVTLFGGKEDRDTREIARATREAGAQAMKESAKAKREAERADKASEQPVSRLDVGVEKAGLMLTVTALAAKKMKEAIQTKTTDPKAGFRLVPSPSKPNQLKIVLDREKGGDQIVESEGVKILLLSPEVAPMLEGMVIDYHETPEGGGFTISKIASEQNT